MNERQPEEATTEAKTRLLNDGKSYEVQLSEVGAAKVRLLLADANEKTKGLTIPGLEKLDDNAILNAALSRGLNAMIRDALGLSNNVPWPYLPGAGGAAGYVGTLKVGE